ncbi:MULTISPECIES: glycosyltransferase [unclassified Dehalobacter]|jgi:glycosyltransferase involved in cell wall biosynthesis|uniref:glycosyltransferase n=1 Tax=unclassified Dehalobacter TaxID=2635733 RepID=UPI0002FB5FD7|nr:MULTISPECIES: glycosyltransferase [unclassified Dehalobacter]MDJ0306019.1 glycosyltransferase [Dehalobacter sp.]OCZ49474.1 glycosyl transferase [Dehalobacter sp. TeCB1]
MIPPFISYITFNRLGLTARNLDSILDTSEEFEMHIIDSNSRDDTWEYLRSLQDPRIQSVTRLPLNCGPIYPLNLNLSRRKPEQYFLTIDSDVFMISKKWISRFMEVFETFPEAGLLGVKRGKPYPRYYPPVIPRVKDNIHYLQLENGHIDAPLDFVPGCCQALRPELINQIGYWNEECCYGDSELSARICCYTDFKAGFIDTVEIEMTQSINCAECQAERWCSLNHPIDTCFDIWRRYYINRAAAAKFRPNFLKVFQELKQGKRSAYSASMSDPESTRKNLYHQNWAMENIRYYIQNSN